MSQVTRLEEELRQELCVRASPDLRARVLAAIPGRLPRAGLADRLWFSRPARWGWAAAVLLLAWGSPWLGGADAPREFPAPAAQRAAAGLVEELGLSSEDQGWIERSLAYIEPAGRDGRRTIGGWSGT